MWFQQVASVIALQLAYLGGQRLERIVLNANSVDVQRHAAPAPEFVDFYKVLRVPPDASAAFIRMAYRLQSQASHPDKVLSLGRSQLHAGQRQQLLNLAYTALRNPELRREHDLERLRHEEGRPDHEEEEDGDGFFARALQRLSSHIKGAAGAVFATTVAFARCWRKGYPESRRASDALGLLQVCG